MARKVFFSFDYDDVMAVNVVRNSNVVRGPDKQLPFADHSLYTAAKSAPGAIKRAIDAAIIGTSVTIVLNGQATWSSSWVRYEIAKSFEKGSGFIVVDIAGVGPRPDVRSGPNPLAFMGATADHMTATTKIIVYEHDGNAWISFSMLPSFSNADAKYPTSMIAGNYRLADRFKRNVAWKSMSDFFDSMIEAAAQEAGWPQAT